MMTEIFAIHQSPINDQEIRDWLYGLRKRAYTPESNFAVSAIVQVRLAELFYYLLIWTDMSFI